MVAFVPEHVKVADMYRLSGHSVTNVSVSIGKSIKFGSLVFGKNMRSVSDKVATPVLTLTISAELISPCWSYCDNVCVWEGGVRNCNCSIPKYMHSLVYKLAYIHTCILAYEYTYLYRK